MKCLEGWTYNCNTQKCYKHVKYESINWTTANRKCQSILSNLSHLYNIRTNLASIANEEENHFLSNLIGSNDDAWIGGYKLLDGSWIWMDGSEWKYTNWYKGEPNNGNEFNEQSLLLYCGKHRDKGKWNDANHESYLTGGFVCQYYNK